MPSLSRQAMYADQPCMYASLADCEKDPLHCIAPTVHGARCQKPLGKDLRAAGLEHRATAQQLPYGNDRDEAVKEFVLAHCCKAIHQEALANKSDCLDQLIDIYGAAMRAVDSGRRSTQPSPQTSKPSKSSASSVRSTSVRETPNDLTTTSDRGTRLRSGKVVEKQTEYFTTYKTSSARSTRKVLLENVTQYDNKSGTVYCFTWPKHPGFVKIGYTKHEANGRIGGWMKCHPGAQLFHQIAVQNPHRIEKLIHAQLSQYRRRIVGCEVCRKGHEEWFEISPEVIKQVMNQWQELTRRHPLYDSYRQLTPTWRIRIANSKGDVTARTLLDYVDAEAASAEECLRLPNNGARNASIPSSRTVVSGSSVSEPGRATMQQSQPSAVPSSSAAQFSQHLTAAATRIGMSQDELLACFADFMAHFVHSQLSHASPRMIPGSTSVHSAPQLQRRVPTLLVAT